HRHRAGRREAHGGSGPEAPVRPGADAGGRSGSRRPDGDPGGLLVIDVDEIDTRVPHGAGRASGLRPILTLAGVEGRRLARHPAIVVIVALAVGQGAQMTMRSGPGAEGDAAWLRQVVAG